MHRFPHPILALLALGLACAGAACAAPHGDLQNARNLYQQGRYRDAEQAADRQLARVPDDPESWRLKIDAAIRAGESARGVDLYLAWHRLRHHYDDIALRSMAESVLLGALRDADAGVRVQAVEAIERASLHALDAQVAALIDDSDPLVAATAALASDGSRGRERSRTLLASPDAEVRARVVAGLGRRELTSAELLHALADAAPAVRRAALDVLGRTAGSDERARLLELARTDQDGPVRAAALRALGRLHGDDILTTARGATGDEHLGARLAALAIVARHAERQPALVPELEALARSSDAFVALRASLALVKNGGQPPVQTLQLALANTQWTVRVAALNTVAEVLPPREALSLIDERMRDSRIEVRLAAARVLMRLGQRGRAHTIFAAALDDPSADARIEAAIDLLRMDAPEGENALARLVENPDPRTRRRAAEAHRHTDNPTLPLIRALGDPDAGVRVAAASALLALL